MTVLSLRPMVTQKWTANIGMQLVFTVDIFPTAKPTLNTLTSYL